MKLIRAALVVGTSSLYLSYVFQLIDGTFWKAGLGDWIDPYFINFLLESWFRSIAAFADPASPPIFFPARGTLGYSHGLILYAPFYAAVRPFLHPFHAHNVTVMLVMETGTVCLYLLLRKAAGLPFLQAFLLTAFFVTSQNVTNATTGIWSQRASVFLIPPILLLAWASVNRSERRLRLALASVTGLLSTLLFTQDVHTGLFVLFFATSMFAVSRLVAGGARVPAPVAGWAARQSKTTKAALVVAALAGLWSLFVSISGGIEGRILGLRISSHGWRRPAILAAALITFVLVRSGPRVSVRRFAANRWRLAFGLGALAGTLVFVRIYLGAYLEHHSFRDDQLIMSLTERVPSRWNGPLDILSELRGYETMRAFELVLIASLLAWIPALKIDRTTRIYAAWFVFLSVVVLLVPLRFGGFSIWLTFFEWLPGFSVIRDPKRIIYVYELVVVLVAATFLSRVGSRSLPGIVTTMVVAVLLVTEWNSERFIFLRPTVVYDQWVDAPIDVDRSCRSFFIMGASPEYMTRSPHMWSLYNVDAAFIALKLSMPTLNGYSALVPDGWGLANPQEPGYAEAVDRWIKRYALTDVCAFDIDRRTMRPYRSALE